MKSLHGYTLTIKIIKEVIVVLQAGLKSEKLGNAWIYTNNKNNDSHIVGRFSTSPQFLEDGIVALTEATFPLCTSIARR